MKQAIIVLLCICWTVLVATVEDDTQQWLGFKAKHGKAYSNIQEETRRFSIFKENLRTIGTHNLLYDAGKETYQMGVNRFADMTSEEFLAILKHQSSSRPEFESDPSYIPSFANADIPDSIDWRDSGAVSKVKDQGSCGSCWAFSVTGTLESFFYLKHKQMVLFSEQQLVDCDRSFNAGCGGGEEGPALDYVKKNGIQTEDSYPYEAKNQKCRYNSSAVYTKIKSYVQLPSGDEATLLKAVGSLGPISVALDASGLSRYSKGVYTSTSCSKKESDTDHAVLAVGYGFDKASGLDYWLVKNSWGKDWGESGYFRIKRGSNECAISTDSVYPSFD